MSDFDQIILELVRHFVSRQVIVLDAMRDLRPDIILYAERRIDNATAIQLRRKYQRSLTLGTWGEQHEWSYRLHGIGCHLTHNETGEIIGWDVGSLKRFDKYWFVDHVHWMLNNATTDQRITRLQDALSKHGSSELKTLQDLIFPTLDRLVSFGWLKQSRHRFILLK